MKICFVSTFFTGATLPLIKHLGSKGHMVDAVFLSKEGSTGMETLNFATPLSGYCLCSIKPDNDMYNYLDKSIRLYAVPYRPFNRHSVRGIISFMKNNIVIYNI